MLFNAQATRAFFTAADQIGLPQPIYERLIEEGIDSVAALKNVDDDDWNRLHKNVEVVEAAATRGGERVVRRLPAIAVSKLKVASQAVRYYDCVGRPLETQNMIWDVLRHFKDEQAAIKSQKDANPTDVPKVTKSVPILRWLESFETFLGNVIGTRDIPLSYVIRPSAVPDAQAPPLRPGYPFSDMYGSVSEELVHRATYDHPLFREDSKKVLQLLDEALTGTTYSHTISKFRRSNNGREAFLAVKAQHGGMDKWKLAKDKALTDMRQSTWNGTGTITVSSYINKHRTAFDDLERCATYIPAVEVPSERARVEYLLKGVAECSDVQFKSMVATIQSQEDDDNGPYASFERAASLLLKVCPIVKKSNGKRVRFGQAEVDTAEVKSLANQIKKGPKTGVDIRYYRPNEYKKLSAAEKAELRECKKKNSSNPNPNPKNESKRIKKLVIDAVKAHHEAEEKEREQQVQIASMFASAKDTSKSNDALAQVQAITKMVKDQYKDSKGGKDSKKNEK
jgi:hypothetical protein